MPENYNPDRYIIEQTIIDFRVLKLQLRNQMVAYEIVAVCTSKPAAEAALRLMTKT